MGLLRTGKPKRSLAETRPRRRRRRRRRPGPKGDPQ